MPSYRSHRGLMGGLLLLAIGVILLLDQEGVVSAGHVFGLIWPAFFMLLGVEDLAAGFSPYKRVWGGILFFAGTLLLLNNLGYLHIRFALLGPAALIILGFWLLISRYWQGPRGCPPAWRGRGPMGPRGGPFGPGPFASPPGETPPAGAAAPGVHPSATDATTTGATASFPSQADPSIGQTPYGGYGPGAGFAGGSSPVDYRDWRRQHKRLIREQVRAWKYGWHQDWQHWSGQPPAGPATDAGASRFGSTPFDSNESQFHYSVICSHVERRITAKNFKSGTLSAVLGGFDIDLSAADIEGDEAVIYADAIFGGGQIRIPDAWHVVIEGRALFGAFMDETRQRPPQASVPQKRLVIRGTAVFGGVSIEN